VCLVLVLASVQICDQSSLVPAALNTLPVDAGS
ncbi:uncharacterized, partial [Tachysurus ichikawai]